MTDPRHGGGPNPSDLAWVILLAVVIGIGFLVEAVVEAVAR